MFYKLEVVGDVVVAIHSSSTQDSEFKYTYEQIKAVRCGKTKVSDLVA